MINIVARGLEYKIDESIFKINRICIIYGQNGIGKTILTKAFNVNNNELDLMDKIGNRKSSIVELHDFLNNKSFKMIDVSLFSNNSFLYGNELIIQKNSQKILDIENKIIEFKESINTKSNFLKKKLQMEFGEETQKCIYKQFLIKKNTFDFEHFNKNKINISSKMQEVLKYFNSQNQLEEIIKLFKNIISIFEMKRSFNKNFFTKYDISLKNISSYEDLVSVLEKHFDNFDHNKCPICLSKLEWNKCLKEIISEINKFRKSDENEKLDIKKKWSDLNVNKKLIIWNDDIYDDKFIDGVKNLVGKYKDVSFTNEAKYFIAIECDLFNKLDYYTLINLKKNQPILDKEFEFNFNKSINNSLSLKKDEIKWRIEDNKIIFTSKKPDVGVDKVLSTSSKKILAICYALATISKQEIVIFDDPTDSNDYLNLGFLVNQIKSISTDRNIIIFTHDIKLIDEFIVQKQKDENLINLSIIEREENKILIKKLENITSVILYISDLYKSIDLSKKWQHLIIFAMLFRIIGKEQKILKFNRKNEDIKIVFETIWNEISKIFHYQKIDEKRINEILMKTKEIYGLNKEYLYKEQNIKSTKEFLNYLLEFCENGISHQFKKNKKIIKNFLKSVKIRIVFEQKYLKNQNEYSNSISIFGEEYKIPNFEHKNPKNETLVSFSNKYKSILNNLSHSKENNFYKFIDINESILNEADNELKKIK